MLLNHIFPKTQLSEGGNLASHKDDGTPAAGWQGIPGQHQAQELDLNVHNRTYVVDVLSDLLHKINDTFARQYKEPLWHKNSVEAQKFLSGSTAKFFDKKISDEEFVRVKPKVGDIDTQAPDKHAETIREFLASLVGKQVGDASLIGFSPGNNQYTSMWQVTLDDLPVKLQIDFEYGAHDPETGLPTDWQDYSHSSSWEDLSAGIKGVFHKYIDRALPYAANVTTKYVARVLKTSTKISPEPVTDSDYSFAVSGQGGGGVSRKYIPYNDPNTGEPMEKDGIPVMQLLDPKNRQYIQNLSQQFEIFFGRKPTAQDQQLKNSFIGTVQLANKYLDDAERTELFNRFVSICFEPGSQMITKNDPVRDRNTKMAAIDYMIDHMKLPNPQKLRKQAIQTAVEYEKAFNSKVAGKAAAAPVSTNEAEEQPAVKAQLRKGMPHLRDLKPLDLLDLLDEIRDENGAFKLQNIPLNVKVDGFGGRFGKNADGKPFMGTSRTEPRYQAGFLQYHQQKGTTDPEILGRAKIFDDLFNEMMNAIKLVDSKLGADFLVDKQVTCEVLFLPFATETPEGKLKFVGIAYDKLPQDVQLALVPFRVTSASTGEDLPDAQEQVKQMTSLGKLGSVMFIDNSLTQNEALDVTALVPPLENLETFKEMLLSKDKGSLQRKRDVAAALQPVALALEKAIGEDPNIVGKDILGKDYEGIVINSRLGPIKVTSPEQKQIIANKNAAKVSARTERPRDNQNKTAVVAIGSFVGHIGHEQLWEFTRKRAAELGGDPYLFIGTAQGKDDPIPPEVKVQTWHKLYPEFAKQISTVQAGGTLMQKIKHELINPLPGKPPRYDNIIIMVGEDRADMPIAGALMKAVNKFQGYEHVKVSLEVTPRETGVRFTDLRNILKNQNATPEEQYATWARAFDEKKLGKDWILKLMDLTRQGMGIVAKQPVPERLFNALVKPELFENVDPQVSIVFDHFNPPSKDSKEAWEVASKTKFWYVGTNHNKSDSKSKQPLPFNAKIACMEKVWPAIKSHLEITEGWLELAAKAYKEHGGLELFVCTEHDDIHKEIMEYNGHEGRHGYYKFKRIIREGVPHPSYEKKLREAVKKQDRKAFTEAAGVSASYEITIDHKTYQYFDLMEKYLGNKTNENTTMGTPTAPKKSWADYGMQDQVPTKPKEKVYHGWQEYEHDVKQHDQEHEKEIGESTSLETTIKAIVADISEPVAAVYDQMKFQAKKYIERNGELDKGFNMLIAGIGGRWFQNMYFGKLQNELYDLTKYNTRHTVELQQFLRGTEVKGVLETPKGFANIASVLPEILSKIGSKINAPTLVRAASNWASRRQEYKNYIDDLKLGDEDDYEIAPKVKQPKDTTMGKQNVQADQIVNDILRKLPSKVAGDIRNAISRAPNKIQALQLELNKRGVKLPTNEAFKQYQEYSDVEKLQLDLWDLYKDVTGYRPRPGTVDWTHEQWNDPVFLKNMIAKLVKQLNNNIDETGQQLSIQQLATISDEALDNAYHYGRSSPGNTFGWQANLKSAAYAKQMIDAGVTDIEKISDAIHKGWNVTAKAFVQNPNQFDDTEKLRASGKLEAKLQQRAQLMKQNYAQLPEEEKEKDRVVARALLNAIRGDLKETPRMSNAVKLQRAWEREQAKSTASRKRGEEVMAQAKKDAENKSKEQKVSEYGDTAKGQKMLTKVQKRAVDRVVSKKADTDPKYAKKNADTADRAWDRMTDKDVAEGWSQKYKKSINCSHPKGFSQKAHCAGKRKHNESMEMEMVCPDCGMCESHGSLNEIKKGQKDSNGFTKCWPGKHAEGTKKGKNGGQVRNCVPNESINKNKLVKVGEDIENRMARLIRLLENK